MTEQRPTYHAPSLRYENLPEGATNKPCPKCQQPLFWSTLYPPQIVFDHLTAEISHIELDRWCICGYAETGFINIDRQPVWTEIIEDNTDRPDREVKERARLAAQFLIGSLSVSSFKVDAIAWEQGLEAMVTIDGVQVGTLIDVYNRYREGDFFYWLRSQIDKTKER